MKQITKLYMFFYCILVLIVTSCNKDNSPTEPSGNEEEKVTWNYGSSQIYQLNTNVAVKDNITNYSFVVSNGNGNLKITRVLSGPDISEADSAFKVEYSGTGELNAVLAGSSTDNTYLLGYADYEGLCQFNSNTKISAWLPVPEIKTVGNSHYYFLPIKEFLEKASNNKNIMWAGASAYRKLPVLKATVADIEAQVQSAITNLIDIVPASRKTDVQNKMNSSSYKYSVYVETKKSNVQPCYIPYWGLANSVTIGNTCTIVINKLMTYSIDKSVSHETGHYLYHLLTGSGYQTLSSGKKTTNHGIGNAGAKNSLIEELSYMSEYYLKGVVGSNTSPENPYDFFAVNGQDPNVRDYTDMEGFTTAMIAAVVGTKSNKKNFANQSVDLPEIIQSANKKDFFTDMVEIFASGTNYVPSFRQKIENLLSTKYSNADKLPVVLQSIGWTYGIKCTFVDKNGNQISGLKAKSITKTNNGLKTYSLPLSTNASDSKGEFHLARCYPGKNFLRIYLSTKDSIDVSVDVDWSLPTNKEVDLGKILAEKNAYTAASVYFQPISSTSSFITFADNSTYNNALAWTNKPNTGGSVIQNLIWDGNKFSVNYSYTDYVGTIRGEYDATNKLIKNIYATATMSITSGSTILSTTQTITIASMPVVVTSNLIEGTLTGSEIPTLSTVVTCDMKINGQTYNSIKSINYLNAKMSIYLQK